MIRTVLVMLLGICCILSACGEKEPRYAVVTAKPFLVLRASPQISGAKIGELPLGSRVEIIGDSNAEETIGGLKNRWLKVKAADGNEGWAFGAFMSIDTKSGGAPSRSPDGYRQPDRTADQTRAIGEFIANPLGLADPRSQKERLPEIAEKFGEPARLERIADRWVHSPGECTSNKIQYEGLFIFLYCGNYIFDMKVSGDRFALNHGTHIGMTREEVLKRYGAPDEEKNNVLIYHQNAFFARDSFSAVKFHVEGGVVKSIISYNHPN